MAFPLEVPQLLRQVALVSEVDGFRPLKMNRLTVLNHMALAGGCERRPEPNSLVKSIFPPVFLPIAIRVLLSSRRPFINATP